MGTYSQHTKRQQVEDRGIKMKNLIWIAMAIVVLTTIGVATLPTALATALVYFGMGNLGLCLAFMLMMVKGEN